MKILRNLVSKKQSVKAAHKDTLHHVQSSSQYSSDDWEARRKKNKKQFSKDLKEKNKISKEKVKFRFEFIPFKDIKPALVVSAILLVISVVVVQSFNWAANLLQQPVLIVDVQGEFKYLEKSVIAEIVNESLESGYLQTDLPSLHTQLLARPWVKEASLKRKLNSVLEISLREHTPLAVWNNKTLISAEAVLFTPKVIPLDLNLTYLSGNNHLEVLAVYQDVVSGLPSSLLPVTALSIGVDGAMTVSTSSGMALVVDKDNWQDQLQRFLIVSRQALSNRMADVEKIDMRYTNGAAVSWRESSVARVHQ